VEEYLHYHHTNTRKSSLLLYTALFSKLYPVQQALIPEEAVIRGEVEGVVDFISSHYFRESHFLIGNSLTVADLAAYFELATLELVDFGFGRWENVSKWM
jgi:glutathione S-transferase